MIYPAVAVFLLTSFGLLFFLDAGAAEAGIALYLAPANALLGVLVCIHAYMHRRPRAGALGLVLCAFWPVYTLVLMHTERGVLRQILLCIIDFPFILSGLGLSLLSYFERRRAAEQEEHNSGVQPTGAADGPSG